MAGFPMAPICPGTFIVPGPAAQLADTRRSASIKRPAGRLTDRSGVAKLGVATQGKYMRRFRFVRTTAILGILLFLALFRGTPAHSRNWDLGDSLSVAIRQMANEQRYQELLEVLPPLVQAARVRGDSLQLGRLLCARGQAELGTGNITASERFLIDAARLSEANADTLTWLTALGVRAFALNHQARFDETTVVLDRQIEIARAADDTLGMAYALLSTGYTQLNLGNAPEARRAYTEAEVLFAAAGSIQYQLTALTGLGRAYSQLDQYDDAEASLRRAVEIAPSWPEARRRLGDLLLSRPGRTREGLAELETYRRLKAEGGKR